MAVAAGFAIAGAALQFVSTYQAYQDQQVQFQANISQIGSNIRTLDLDAEILGIQRRRGRKAADLQQGLFDLNLRELDIRRNAIDSEKGFLNVSKEISEQNIALDTRSLEINRRGQRAAAAFARGQIKVGIAEANAKARIETAQAKFIDAFGGASAFTRAFSQSSINAVSSLEQQQKGLELRGLLDRELFEVSLGKQGLKTEQLQAEFEAGISRLETQADIITTQEEGVELRKEGLTTDEQLQEELLTTQEEKIAEQQAELERQGNFVAQQADDGLLGEILGQDESVLAGVATVPRVLSFGL